MKFLAAHLEHARMAENTLTALELQCIKATFYSDN
jgi:hypothetical protein